MVKDTKDTKAVTLRAHDEHFTAEGTHVYTDEYDSYNAINASVRPSRMAFMNGRVTTMATVSWMPAKATAWLTATTTARPTAATSTVTAMASPTASKAPPTATAMARRTSATSTATATASAMQPNAQPSLV